MLARTAAPSVAVAGVVALADITLPPLVVAPAPTSLAPDPAAEEPAPTSPDPNTAAQVPERRPIPEPILESIAAFAGDLITYGGRSPAQAAVKAAAGNALWSAWTANVKKDKARGAVVGTIDKLVQTAVARQFDPVAYIDRRCIACSDNARIVVVDLSGAFGLGSGLAPFSDALGNLVEHFGRRAGGSLRQVIVADDAGSHEIWPILRDATSQRTPVDIVLRRGSLDALVGWPAGAARTPLRVVIEHVASMSDDERDRYDEERSVTPVESADGFSPVVSLLLPLPKPVYFDALAAMTSLRRLRLTRASWTGFAGLLKALTAADAPVEEVGVELSTVTPAELEVPPAVRLLDIRLRLGASPDAIQGRSLRRIGVELAVVAPRLQTLLLSGQGHEMVRDAVGRSGPRR